VHPLDRIKKTKQNKTKNKKEHYTGSQDRKSRPPVFIGLNSMEMLILLLPHGRQREFFAWDSQIGPVILRGLH
jgi:hypothetical protein